MSNLAPYSQRWLSTAAGTLDHIACLKDIRSVLRLSGPTLVHFLQGLVTNDVTTLETPGSSPLYTCILNAQGRYLHDIFLHPIPSSTPAEPSVYLDTDASGKDDLLRLLKRYRLRQKIEIDDVSAELEVWTRFGTNVPPQKSSAGSTNRESYSTWLPDPRLPSLGLRTLLPAGASPPSQANTVPWEAYRRWRITQGVAEGDSEIPSGDAIALEYNIDGLNGISFTKGCYVGQELMARTHFKGVVRKRIMPFEVCTTTVDSSNEGGGSSRVGGGIESGTGAGDVKSGETIVDGATGKIVGVVRVVDDGQGLAHVRLKEALETIDGKRTLKTEGGSEILPGRPQWWPSSWGREDQY